MFSLEGRSPSKTPFFIFSFKGEGELVMQWRLCLPLPLTLLPKERGKE